MPIGGFAGSNSICQAQEALQIFQDTSQETLSSLKDIWKAVSKLELDSSPYK